ncbi:MAG: AraC family transcriptional regulator [Lachnospiraceae bacterium]|nr:AraC family transcriptional regulator [Lachnospiraceae bacterium]
MPQASAQPNASLPMRIFFSGHEQTVKKHACGPGIWPHYLLHFVLSGTGSFTSAGRTWHLSAGDAFLIVPGIVSSYMSSEDTPWEYCWIGFDGRDVKNTLDTCMLNAENPVFHSVMTVPFAGTHQCFPVGETILSINDALLAEPGNSYLHLSLLYRLFSLMLPPGDDVQKSSTSYINQAIDYIQHNYAYDIRIQDVAHHVGIDRTYLYKLFLRELGTSPQQFLISYRLSMAKQLLSSTTLQITEISNSCGFTDSASFCHQFRKQFQLTPSQFRREPGNAPVK